MSTATPTHERRTSDVPDRAQRRGPRRRGPVRPGQLLKSLPDAFRKLDPRVMVKSPVMFVVRIGSVLTTVLRRSRTRATGSAGRSASGCG